MPLHSPAPWDRPAARRPRQPRNSAAPKRNSCLFNVETGQYDCYGSRKAAERAAVAQDDVILGILHDQYDYQGASLVLTGDRYCYSNGAMDFSRQLPHEWRTASSPRSPATAAGSICTPGLCGRHRESGHQARSPTARLVGQDHRVGGVQLTIRQPSWCDAALCGFMQRGALLLAVGRGTRPSARNPASVNPP